MANPIDQVITKGAGLAHEVKAHMDGLVGVFSTLAEQHGEAASLLRRMQADPSKRAEIWPTLRTALRAHEQGELKEVYPALREYPGLRGYADRHSIEANELSRTIDRMDGLDVKGAEFGRYLDNLARLVTSHAQEEETQIFPAAQAVLGEERVRAMDAAFRLVAKQVKDAETAGSH